MDLKNIAAQLLLETSEIASIVYRNDDIGIAGRRFKHIDVETTYGECIELTETDKLYQVIYSQSISAELADNDELVLFQLSYEEKPYVIRLFYDDLTNLSDTEKCIQSPVWEDIEKIIDKLDGKSVTQITMDNGNEDSYFCIGGGNNGLCNVFISENDNATIHTLTNPDADPSLVRKLVTGGQEGDFDDRLCVTTETARRAAKTYFYSGTMDNSCVWE